MVVYKVYRVIMMVYGTVLMEYPGVPMAFKYTGAVALSSSAGGLLSRPGG